MKSRTIDGIFACIYYIVHIHAPTFLNRIKLLAGESARIVHSRVCVLNWQTTSNLGVVMVVVEQCEENQSVEDAQFS